MIIRFTSEELKGIEKQPKDTCPALNEVLMKIESENTEGSSVTFVEKCLKDSLSNIYKINQWKDQWKHIYQNNQSLSKDDPFVEAYITTANEIEETNSLDIEDEIYTLIENYENYHQEVLGKEFSNDNNEFNSEELKENDLYIIFQKRSLTDSLENIRKYAVKQRELGTHYKNAYKHISVEHDFDDLLQPQEIINEEQGNAYHIFNVGILDHKRTIHSFVEDGILSEIEAVLVQKMNDEKKQKFLIDKIKEKRPEIEKIIYFENMEDYQNKKGYKIEKNKSNKLNNQNKLK